MKLDSSSGWLILVTGPTRSGKSEWAELLASESGQHVTYIATSQIDPKDLEWQQRITRHHRRRPTAWETLEVPVELVMAIRQTAPTSCLLIDSLGTWLSNVLDQDEDTWKQTLETLCQSLKTAACSIIIVAEETGWGVVPAYTLGRTFRDRLGEAIRRIGALADSVYLVTGGYATDLSKLGTPLPGGNSSPNDKSGS